MVESGGKGSGYSVCVGSPDTLHSVGPIHQRKLHEMTQQASNQREYGRGMPRRPLRFATGWGQAIPRAEED